MAKIGKDSGCQVLGRCLAGTSRDANKSDMISSSALKDCT